MPRTVFVALVALTAAPSCWTTVLLPGRCDKTSDCAAGLVCNLEPTLQGNGRCVVPDGGLPDGGPDGTPDGPDDKPDGAPDGTPDGAFDARDAMPGCSASAPCPASSPICDAVGTCRACDAAGVPSNACAQADATRPVCSSTGSCVECQRNTDCTDATKPICDAGGVCRACNAAGVPTNACSQVAATRAVCASSGACVACSASAHCTADKAKPICDGANQQCVACSSDAQCVEKLGANPGVCMSHQDGRCATDAETFHVANKTGCSDTGPGSLDMPFCSLEPAAQQVGGARNVVVVRGAVLAPTSDFGVNAAVGTSAEISIIGREGGSAASAVGASALNVPPGRKLYARSVSVTAVNGMGIVAQNQSSLRLDHVFVSNSMKGGVFIAGAAYDISDTTITGNGPGSDGAVGWGGLYVKYPPTAGPTRLNRVTVTNNQQFGINCTGPITGTAVFVSGNQGGDVNQTCALIPCSPASAACGAQP